MCALGNSTPSFTVGAKEKEEHVLQKRSFICRHNSNFGKLVPLKNLRGILRMVIGDLVIGEFDSTQLFLRSCFPERPDLPNENHFLGESVIMGLPYRYDPNESASFPTTVNRWSAGKSRVSRSIRACSGNRKIPLDQLMIWRSVAIDIWLRGQGFSRCPNDRSLGVPAGEEAGIEKCVAAVVDCG